MKRQELIQCILQKLIKGLDKIEKNNEQEFIDLTYCQDQYREIKSNKLKKTI